MARKPTDSSFKRIYHTKEKRKEEDKHQKQVSFKEV